MAQLVAQFFTTLDGVVQAPGDPDEDRSGGFSHGGWHLPYFEPRSQAWVIDTNARAAAYLYGRRTYDVFKHYWPNATEADAGPLPAMMNGKPKWVASRTIVDPLEWSGSQVLPGDDAVAGVAQLKEQITDGDLLLMGSTTLARSLLAAGLIDRLELMVDPVVLGTGARLFDHGLPRLDWELTAHEATPTGALLLRYDRRGD